MKFGERALLELKDSWKGSGPYMPAEEGWSLLSTLIRSVVIATRDSFNADGTSS